MGWDVPDDDPNVRQALEHPGPLATVVCSRLGHDTTRHRLMARHLAASMQAMRASGATLLIADGTAVGPWAMQAADLFGVPILLLNKSDDRDLRLISLADRVDVAYCRPKGKVTGLIRRRCAIESGIVRVAIGSKHETALLEAGAIGLFLSAESESPCSNTDLLSSLSADSLSPCIAMDQIDWDEFLVHCTRAAPGPWPKQTIRQYRDEMLLGDAATASRSAPAALARIVRGRRLIAGAVTSSHQIPVVCFSAVPLPELLSRRTYRSHLHRWDYEPYGIAIRKTAAEQIGIEPVVYAEDVLRSGLGSGQLHRFQACGKTTDWRVEKEWRAAEDVDLDALDPTDVCVFSANGDWADRLSTVNHRSWPLVNVPCPIN
ncbi:hypothetical protein Pla100_42020 [Neorhodopirellula pilleata]|uniref:Uncharacterized protein n=2 Tax=Neorhodopirellula pilleata TaxID=2714738 RepID=A0A5C6A1H5_9BACT|nr:hypothetical protein Pla100_42020 [Neorhodopirellula pilleata]